ncbi:MAG TPA: putative S-layer protein [Candidatus Paceibacterota bacterium]|nr:putative S-layer protein [Candidatus Paceibacterota bacterium]
MKSKIITLLIFALTLCSLVNAASFSLSANTFSFNFNSNSQTFTVTNTNTASLLNLEVPSSFQINGEDGYSVIFDITGDTSNINHSSSRTLSISPQSTIDYSKFNFQKTYSSSIILSNNLNSSDNQTITVNIVKSSLCNRGKVGYLNMDIELSNNGFLGGDDTIWYPTEEITAEINVESSSSDDIDDIIVTWGVYNKRTGEFLIDEEESDFDLDSRDDKLITVSFSIDPKDLDSSDNENDYIFFTKVYSDDLGEDSQCEYFTENIKIPQDSDFVIVSDINIPETVQCGENLIASFRLWNIGDSDQEDISVSIFNKDIPEIKNGRIITVGDLDSFDSSKESVEFEIPKNLTEGNYILEFRVFDEDNELFENDEDKQSVFLKSFKIQGSCEIPKSVLLSATLASESIAGQELTVKTTVKNTGLGDTTYVIQIPASSYESWATLKSDTSTTVSLKSGESKDINVVLLPNKKSVGDHDFSIQAIYGNLETTSTVKLTIEKPKSIFSNINGFSLGGLGDNWFIWIVAILNIVLVVLIVVIAIKIAKK